MASSPVTRRILRAAGDVLQGWLRDRGRTPRPSPARPGGRGSAGSVPRRADAPPGGATGYPGDHTGALDPVYDPHPDGAPDPGEVVWTWVPYEEDHTRGKDRPVLLVGRDGPWLLALPLTSRDHDRDAAQEAREGRLWVDVGSGGWDRQGRPSEARVDRVVRVDPDAVRREGAVLSADRFAVVAQALSRRRS
ncbi:type II toxin-antitoxin system PemK/MazF family toxin [Oryzobacter terrae]|uniref:type II toxin-antitoxin system PemK/MazF family toxin n=1 Tax=Oryzobacter terrae TaxID=1620385 RepID=UPI00366E97B1